MLKRLHANFDPTQYWPALHFTFKSLNVKLAATNRILILNQHGSFVLKNHFDVLIVGGGPAGSTTGALLAEAGLSCCIIEKESFPRFHIGESLLPGGNDILQRLGVWDKMDDAGFLRKYGAEFISTDGSQQVHNIFARGLKKGLDYTYQVERAKFDQLLIDNAAAKGATVMHQQQVLTAELIDQLWQVETRGTGSSDSPKQTFTAKWLIDASGRNAFYGKSRKLPRDTIPYPKRLAVYSHFSGVKVRTEGEARGNILVTRLSDGWFWVIPLDAEKTSVGVVSTKKREEWQDESFTPQAFFDKEVARSPYLTDLMSNATVKDEFRVTADYTYSHTTYADKQMMLVGDAAGFIDPVFSSGVYLALRSGQMAADAIIKADKGQRVLSAKEAAAYTKTLKRNVRVMRDLIEVYYSDKGFSVFMSPTNKFKLFDSVNSILAGNTSPGLAVWWRFKLFRIICWLNRRIGMVPDQEFS